MVQPDRPHDNMARVHCVLKAYGYKTTLGICNTYCSPIATMAIRIRLTITFVNIICL
jgi:hypothetical protein